MGQSLNLEREVTQKTQKVSKESVSLNAWRLEEKITKILCPSKYMKAIEKGNVR